MKATAKDFRFHSKEILNAVSRGEELIITYRGKPHAKIVPIKSSKKESSDEHSLFGIWDDNDSVKEVEKHVRELRNGRFK